MIWTLHYHKLSYSGYRQILKEKKNLQRPKPGIPQKPTGKPCNATGTVTWIIYMPSVSSNQHMQYLEDFFFPSSLHLLAVTAMISGMDVWWHPQKHCTHSPYHHWTLRTPFSGLLQLKGHCVPQKPRQNSLVIWSPVIGESSQGCHQQCPAEGRKEERSTGEMLPLSTTPGGL